ncbi:MAG TPA: SUMF1/EgtB/PvdO family nonheme iron enzyme, partial [Candidatus Hydrogenedentes bacterium]|nr:SUMF1/EgtB/PvdO family nonheme iron enzyme [Candidatus Hydrogenedentota bacterium]
QHRSRCLFLTAKTRRVLRGGSWNNNPDNLRSANRNRNNPDNRNNNNGFRVAVSVSSRKTPEPGFRSSPPVNAESGVSQDNVPERAARKGVTGDYRPVPAPCATMTRAWTNTEPGPGGLVAVCEGSPGPFRQRLKGEG